MRALQALAVAVSLIAPAAGAISLEELVQKHLAARGGVEQVRALRSLRLTGRIAYGDADSTLELRWLSVTKRPGAIRTELTLQGLTAVRAFDGKQGFRISPFGGRKDPERTSPDDDKGLARIADLDGPLVDAAAKKLKLSYLGTEDVDGTAAHKIEVVRPDGDVELIYLDPDHFMTIRVETRTKVRGVESIEERDYGSYQKVAGVWIAFSIESGGKGAPRDTRITVERAEANPALDDALFRMPEAGAPPLTAAGPASSGPAEQPAVSPPSAASGPVRVDEGVLSGLGARNIGSAAMSGRIAALAARALDGKTTVFVGAASGGIWKSIDSATTFRPVFDKQSTQSIGALALDPSHPNVVWAGSGESWTRNSVSHGDGIYKSTDGGETWTNMGLKDSERIARIVVHPKHSDVVYACVPGRLWSDSAERGVYRTGDGGKTWKLVLRSDSLSTGCATLDLDPSNPERLIAGLWDFRRKGWTFRSAGDGPDAPSGSGLHVTTDGGNTWSEIGKGGSAGLPPKPWGRTAVSFAPSNAKIVYAFIESKSSALYRSDDGGKTWEARDRSQNMIWRPFYFAHLIVDPTNPERVFKTDGGLIVSEDGGHSFSGTGGGAHGDWHDVWIDPGNPKHLIGGDDGGLWISHDGGSRWWKGENLPISQFYHVAVDNKDPYQVYGGLQDNSSWAGDSAYPGGIASSRWENVGGGDGFWTFPDPSDPDAVYSEGQGGFIARLDRRTRAIRDIQPKAGYHEKLRFNWNTPIHLSPSQKGTIYIGAQFLFRSRDRGDTWERISPDLTTNDPEKQKQEESGGVTVDNSSAEMHTTIYSISESPKNGQLIWVGTDDGNLQLTRDGGKSWKNVIENVPGLPKASWVSWVEASRFEEGTAYAAFDRHTFGDFETHLFRTRDFGKSWTRLGQGLRGYAHVIKEDLVEQRILYAGTEAGLFISLDAGATWAAFRGGNFPSVAVRDLAQHPRDGDLVIATHGRGIWIIDDVSPLRALAADVLAREVAFLPSRPVQQRMFGLGGWVEGDSHYTGENPPPGAVITYYQRERHLYGPLKLEILDESGALLDTLTPSLRRGVNRVAWSMRHKPPRVPRAAQIAGASTQGPRVLPGRYRVRLTKGAQVIESTFEVGLDRRAPWSLEDRKAQHAAALRIRDLFGSMTALVERLQTLKAGADARAAGLPAGDPLGVKLRSLGTRTEELRKLIVATKEGGAITGEERLREHADQLYGALNFWEGRPGQYQLERIAVLERELGDVDKSLGALVASEVPALDRELQQRKLETLPTAAPKPSPHADVSSADFRSAVGAFFGQQRFDRGAGR